LHGSEFPKFKIFVILPYSALPEKNSAFGINQYEDRDYNIER
jgi:hypothetical protein